jgi:hypothetical protein
MPLYISILLIFRLPKTFIFAQNSELANGAVSKILSGAKKFQKNT